MASSDLEETGSGGMRRIWVGWYILVPQVEGLACGHDFGCGRMFVLQLMLINEMRVSKERRSDATGFM
jgi:hypothetical protein